MGHEVIVDKVIVGHHAVGVQLVVLVIDLVSHDLLVELLLLLGELLRGQLRLALLVGEVHGHFFMRLQGRRGAVLGFTLLFHVVCLNGLQLVDHFSALVVGQNVLYQVHVVLLPGDVGYEVADLQRPLLHVLPLPVQDLRQRFHDDLECFRAQLHELGLPELDQLGQDFHGLLANLGRFVEAALADDVVAAVPGGAIGDELAQAQLRLLADQLQFCERPLEQNRNELKDNFVQQLDVLGADEHLADEHYAVSQVAGLDALDILDHVHPELLEQVVYFCGVVFIEHAQIIDSVELLLPVLLVSEVGLDLLDNRL